jgi:hypothetical protein
MKQKIDCENYDDAFGTPTGGFVRGIGIDIEWQNGSLGRGDNRQPQNGAFVEGVISAALQRIQYYQQSKFNCRENAIAITKLQEALFWLEARTKDREERQVEGTHEV